MTGNVSNSGGTNKDNTWWHSRLVINKDTSVRNYNILKLV